MNNSTTTYTSSIGFFGLLFLVLLVLKLTHVISWSWWWVTAPLWGGVLIGILFLLVVYVIAKWLFDR